MGFDRDIKSINSLINDLEPITSFSDNLLTLFTEFSSLLENVIDQLDELENKVLELKITIAAQQKEIEELQSVS